MYVRQQNITVADKNYFFSVIQNVHIQRGAIITRTVLYQILTIGNLSSPARVRYMVAVVRFPTVIVEPYVVSW